MGLYNISSETYCVISLSCNYINFTGPPILQAVKPLYYVIAGNPFTLNCTATSDPQSPNELRFRWFKESTRIDNNPAQWNITEVLLRNALTITSQIVITHLTVEQHNGTYTCSVDNYSPRMAVDQITSVIVESKNYFMIAFVVLVH